MGRLFIHINYTKAISLNPISAMIYNNRGSLYYSMKLYDQAVADYSKAIEIDAKFYIAYIGRADMR